VGDIDEGFHVGGGVSFGTYVKDKNFFHVLGMGGFHFTVAHKIQIHADAGLTLASADSKTQLWIGGHSAILGLSLVYRL
jgi:hypothetical protein